MGKSEARSGKRRRWFQFRIRTLLVFVLVLSLALSWLAVRMREARREHEALEHLISLQKHPGELEWAYDFQIDADGKPIPGATCPGPAWARKWLGDEFFCHVAKVSIQVYGPPPGVQAASTETPDVTMDEWMALLEHFRGLRLLTVSGESITARGLAKLAGLRHLESLSLAEIDKSVCPEDFSRLDRLTGLHRLYIMGSGVTDEALRQLPALPELEWLDVRGGVTGEFLKDFDAPKLKQLLLTECPVQDASALYLRRFPSLKTLDLTFTRMTDEGLRCLRDAPLVDLRLYGLDITDDGLAVLPTMPQLESLDLDNTKVTDKGLRHLTRIPKLKILFLQKDMEGRGPYITKRALDDFQKLEPGVQVHSYGLLD